MKLIDINKKYKIDYSDYVIFIKSGVFYYVFDSDVCIINALFNYNIKSNGTYCEIGFPISSIGKITKELENNNINFIVLEKDEDYIIVDKYKSNKNKYNNYLFNINKYNYIQYRIEKLYKRLLTNLNNDNIEDILNKIDELI